MWIRLSLAPVWVRVLAFLALSAMWAGIFTVMQWYQDGTLHGHGSLIAMIVVGVGAAAVWSAVAVSQTKQRYGGALADVDLPATRAAALKAAFSGPIPTDPVVRRVAAALAAIRVHELGKRVRREIIACAGLAVVTVGATIWAIGAGSVHRAVISGVLAVWFIGAAVRNQWTHQRAVQRHRLLTEGPGPAGH